MKLIKKCQAFPFSVLILAFPLLPLAQGTKVGQGNFANPLGDTTTLEAVLQKIWNYLYSIAGYIAIIFIIIGGVMYMLSAGDEKRAETAKKTLIYAIMGLAIVVGSTTIFREIAQILGYTGTTSVTGKSAVQIATSVIQFLLGIVGFIFIISTVIGGMMYMGASGDTKKAESGKKMFFYSIIGLTICLASLIIASQIKTFIGG